MDAQDPIQPTTDKTTAGMPAPTLPSTGEAGGSASTMHTDKNKNWLNWVLLGAVFVSLVALLVNIDRSLFVAPQADSVDTEATLTLELQGDAQVAQGDQFQVLVKMQNSNTNQLTYGADIVLSYDEATLEYISAQVPAGVPNGCTTTDPNAAAVVLAPVTSADANGCEFNNSVVKAQADQAGELRFGAVSFNWAESDTDGYTPVAFPAGTAQSLALVTFKVKDTAVDGSTDISFNFVANQTDESNVGVIQSQVVGDALASVNGTTANVGAEAPTPTTDPNGSAADLNNDGDVDTTDLELWAGSYRCQFPGIAEQFEEISDCADSPAAGLPIWNVIGDIDGNGSVNLADYTVWWQEFN